MLNLTNLTLRLFKKCFENKQIKFGKIVIKKRKDRMKEQRNHKPTNYDEIQISHGPIFFDY